MWFDTHAHLDMEDYQADRPQVIERAMQHGFSGIITIGIDLMSSCKALALAKLYRRVWATVGVHPHDAASFKEAMLPQLEQLARDPLVVAVGEIGLDYYRNLSPQRVQKEVFRILIGLARNVSLPVVIHDREAHNEVLNILREEKASEIGGVFHCFSGDWEMAKKCLEMNFYLSVTGALTYKRGSVLEEVVRRAPLESLLLETDAPFLSPHPFRGKRNEPAYAVHTAQYLAAVRGIPLEALGRTLLENTYRAFPRLKAV